MRGGHTATVTLTEANTGRTFVFSKKHGKLLKLWFLICMLIHVFLICMLIHVFFIHYFIIDIDLLCIKTYDT